MINTTLTFDDLVKLEPRLQALYQRAQRFDPDAGNCYINAWYREFKPVLVRLVGWESKHPNITVRGTRAYNLAYQTILEAMSRCPKGCQGCD